MGALGPHSDIERAFDCQPASWMLRPHSGAALQALSYKRRANRAIVSSLKLYQVRRGEGTRSRVSKAELHRGRGGG